MVCLDNHLFAWSVVLVFNICGCLVETAGRFAQLIATQLFLNPIGKITEVFCIIAFVEFAASILIKGLPIRRNASDGLNGHFQPFLIISDHVGTHVGSIA